MAPRDQLKLNFYWSYGKYRNDIITADTRWCSKLNYIAFKLTGIVPHTLLQY